MLRSRLFAIREQACRGLDVDACYHQHDQQLDLKSKGQETNE
jgi:hypothetical protein